MNICVQLANPQQRMALLKVLLSLGYHWHDGDEKDCDFPEGIEKHYPFEEYSIIEAKSNKGLVGWENNGYLPIKIKLLPLQEFYALVKGEVKGEVDG